MKRRLLILLTLLALCAALISVLCAASKAVTETEITYLSRGVHVPATVTTPQSGSGHPVVIMAHGHNGTRDERYGFVIIARELARRGVASIRMDFPGCGESSEPFTQNNLQRMVSDLEAAAAYARDTLNAPSVGFFGYSMGGRAVMELLAGGAQADAAAFLAPASDTNDLIRFFGGSEAFAQRHRDALQSGSAAITEHEIVGPAWFEDLLRIPDPAAAAAKAYDGPALILYGSDDPVVPPDVCLRAAEALSAQTLDVGGKGHGYGFFREDDELLARIAKETAQFFSQHLR